MNMIRNLLAAMAAAMVLAGCASSVSAPQIRAPLPPPRLKVMTWNIHHAEGADKRIDLERVAAIIKRENPDIVALQEVDVGVPRSGGVDQLQELSRLTGMPGWFGKAIMLDGGAYGNAMLSRFPLADPGNPPRAIGLNPPGTSEARCVLESDIQIRPGLTMKILVTHFDTNPKTTPMNALTLNHSFQFMTPGAGILMGDLNATPDNEALKELGKLWKRLAGSPEAPTWPSHALDDQEKDREPRSIDHILVRPAAAWRQIAFKVLDEPVASDHRPVVAELEYAPQKHRYPTPSAPMPPK
jgi:endonuclease/exonuclease/phosphatase family metal-dependent hydrolase